MGGRPTIPDIPGALEHCITSDDIFYLEKAPGKTLVVGAGYIALECAGYLNTLGMDTTVLVRSILLRGFDRQLAELVGNYMDEEGVKFVHKSSPTNIEKNEEGKLVVTYKTEEGDVTDTFDTVVIATGRHAVTKSLNLEAVGVETDAKGKIVVDKYERTSVENIYAIGDVASGILELTPVAIQAGRLLAERLYTGSKKLMNYDLIPTTLFTPLEYGFCGLSEEDAIERYGEDDIEVYHSFFTPLEYFIPDRLEGKCYAKLVCRISENEKVLGMHFLGPHAGEITQGYAVAMKYVILMFTNI